MVAQHDDGRPRSRVDRGVIAAMAILTRTELLSVLVAGVFVIGPGSVILQRVYFKLTRGKRLFLMSPLSTLFVPSDYLDVCLFACTELPLIKTTVLFCHEPEHGKQESIS